MTLVPKRDYVILLLGDVVIFAASLWLALALRYFEVPTLAFVNLHVPPFAILFAVWVGIFFLAGLYGRYTRLFRSKLLPTILYTQVINILLAALFFLIASTAFGAGYLFARDYTAAPIIIEKG